MTATVARLRRYGVRPAGAALVLWAAATVTFLALHLVPGDPVLVLLGGGSGANPTPETIAAIRHAYGLDQPLYAQYLHHIGRLVTGDLGVSTSLKEPVAGVITQQLPATIELTALALLFAWLLAGAVVLLSTGRGALGRALGSGLETVAAGLPHFWLGVVLLYVFAFRLGWFPVAGGTGIAGLVLPALTLAVPLAGYLGQVTRGALLTALEQPFVTSARLRGMSSAAVRARRALRHALLPPLTLSGWAVGALFSSEVVVESVFARQGIGRALLNAVLARDLPLVTGIVLLIAAVYVLVDLAVDLLHAVVDPRIRTPREL
ncbi:ABC transporter permease [Streptomyces pinistramenti]|uniref:ABC transporter permease n=1 Tax=Streptomyces pinistramenti TaxID=2884812 RepID=UPI001D08872E|nr:ABC transporter permease [Streptomyces pinistramenti]MCB5906337.1 ABC transporter permease [Streptomyces pinistramenti]